MVVVQQFELPGDTPGKMTVYKKEKKSYDNVFRYGTQSDISSKDGKERRFPGGAREVFLVCICVRGVLYDPDARC